MPDTYRTFEKTAEGFFRDRNSRFLAFGYPVISVDQVNEIVASLKKKFHDARHHCYAYRLGPEKEYYRMNDDGEPSGTAGKPIYNQIVSNDLMNVLIVVVRYFGGTLLGTGGLINAYRSAAADLIGKANLTTRFIENFCRLRFPYEKLYSVMKIIKDENLIIADAVYDLECMLRVAIRKSSLDAVLNKLSALDGVTSEMLLSD